MGSTGTRRIHGLTVSRKWAQFIDETDETPKYRRVGNVLVFDTPGQTAPTREDLERDWCGDMEEADER